MEIVRKQTDDTIETLIATAMIMSNSFNLKVRTLFNPDYIQNSTLRVICDRSLIYFNENDKSPGLGLIRDIFDVEAEYIDEPTNRLIDQFLLKVKERYDEGQTINDDYVWEVASEYFTKRELKIRIDKAAKYLEAGRPEEAEKQFVQYKKVAYQTSGWFNPFEEEEIKSLFLDEETGVFEFPGVLGKIIGPIERGWFVGILGAFKRGKSWMLQDIGVIGLRKRLKVAFISLEMKKRNVKERLYRNISSLGAREGEAAFIFPVFDCGINQNNECRNPLRMNRLPAPPEFEPGNPYSPCDVCRGMRNSEYVLSTYFDQRIVPEFSYGNAYKQVRGFRTMFGKNNLFINCYPRFTANLQDIIRDLWLLEQETGFVPDVIIIDYADILKISGKEKIEEIDYIWKMCASLAAERQAIVFTASQGNRGSLYKPNMEQDDLAEWIGKLAHVDIFLGLNQSREEKKKKLLRVNLLGHRHKEFNESDQVLLLQQLEIGKFALEDELYRANY